MVGLTLSSPAFVGATRHAYDIDAATYIAAVEVADGQPLEALIRSAINGLFVGFKADGNLSRLKSACILGVARTLAGSLVPLLPTMPSPTNAGFVAGDRSRTLGLLGNGSTKYLDSNFGFSSANQNDHHALVFLPVLTPITVNEAQIGNGVADTGSTHTFFSTAQSTQAVARSSSSTASIGTTRQVGLLGLNRNNSANFTLRSGVSEESFVAASQSIRTDSNFVFARNGATPSHSVQRIFFYSLGDSLSLGQMQSRLSTFHAAIASALT